MTRQPKRVGDVLHDLIRGQGIKSTIHDILKYAGVGRGCNCRTIRSEMNKLSPAQILNRLDEFTDKLSSSASHWTGLPSGWSFQRDKAKALIEHACEIAVASAA